MSGRGRSERRVSEELVETAAVDVDEPHVERLIRRGSRRSPTAAAARTDRHRTSWCHPIANSSGEVLTSPGQVSIVPSSNTGGLVTVDTLTGSGLASLLLVAVLVASPTQAAPAAAPSIEAGNCVEIAGLRQLIQPGTILLLGEIHGTAEIPDVVSEITCHALHSDVHVSVLLEIPQEEGPRISKFLDSQGTEEGRAALLNGDFWQRSFQDGRSSQAMLDLLERLRLWRRSQSSLRVALIDSTSASSAERERTMAELVRGAVRENPTNFFVSLTGNIHNRLLPLAVPSNDNYEPMAYLLARSMPEARMLSLNVLASGGTAWYCTDECKIHTLLSRETGDTPRIALAESAEGEPFHGTLYVGDVSASLPAAKSNSSAN